MIQSNYELANILGMVFSKYANQVLNGATQPYEALMTQDSVDVVFTVTSEGGFSVKPLVQEKPKVLESLPEAEMMETIKGNPIFSIDELANCVGFEKCKGANASDCISQGKHCPTFTQEELDKMSKPKRSRKKKEPEEVVPTE